MHKSETLGSIEYYPEYLAAQTSSVVLVAIPFRFEPVAALSSILLAIFF
jgi:hypothetical protein